LIIKNTKNKPSQLEKAYYYTAYYYCTGCKRMFLSDEFKVTKRGEHDILQQVRELDKLDQQIGIKSKELFELLGKRNKLISSL